MSSSAPPHRTPAAAPTPPADTGAHATDSQGVRQYDAEDRTAHGIRPAQDRRGPTAPRPTLEIAAPRSTAVNSHRAISATLPPFPIRYSSSNFFIPCFGMMYNIISAMNDKVCSHRDYSDNGPVQDWIPQATVLVYSILAIVQVFRCQRALGLTDVEQSLFLDAFLASFPLETITIPGPLVPFFRSLSISNPGIGDFANVGPAFPNVSYNEERLYAIDYTIPGTDNRFQGIDYLMPHIPLMLDQFRHLITYLNSLDANQAAQRYSAYTQLSCIFGQNTPNAGSALLPTYNRLLRSIGFAARPTASNGLMARFATYYNGAISSFPAAWTYAETHAAVAANPQADPPVAARASQWVEYDHLFQTMGFNTSPDWFLVLLRGMPTFTRHFHGNTRMSDISPMSSAACLVRYRQVQIVANPAARIFGRQAPNSSSHRLVFNTYATTASPHVPIEDFEDSQMAQVNIACEEAFTHGHIGDVNVTHFGDFWSVPPDIHRTNRDDLTQAFLVCVCSPDYYIQ